MTPEQKRELVGMCWVAIATCGIVAIVAVSVQQPEAHKRFHVECTVAGHTDIYDDTADLQLFKGGRLEVNGITYSQGAACKFWNMKRPEVPAIVVPRHRYD